MATEVNQEPQAQEAQEPQAQPPLFPDAEGVTLDQQIAAVAREIKLRENCYQKWVDGGRMKQATADHELAAMRAVLLTLQAARASAKRRTDIDVPADDWLLIQVRDYLRRNANHGTNCPACKQRVEIYTRPFNRSYARNLRAMYVHHRQTGEEWIDVPALLAAQGLGRGNDGAQPLRWGLIEAQGGERADGSNRTGIYRLTPTGIAFVEGRTRIRKFVRVYNGRTLGCKDESTISFAEALGERFDYSTLRSYKAEGESIDEEAQAK
jgi:hypothetical protein